MQKRIQNNNVNQLAFVYNCYAIKFEKISENEIVI